MGQKSNPIGMRLQINRTWDSRWYAEGADYGRLLLEDLKIRAYIMKALPQAAISKVVIERPAKLCRVSIYAARPGVIIGMKGAGLEDLRKRVGAIASDDLSLDIVEVRKPEIDARLVAQGVADQLERRIAFRRAMKRAVQSALRLGAEGIRITCSGHLDGSGMERTEWYREGRVPLHTLRANVDYAEATAHTAYGVCGVKVWIFKGEILGHDPLAQDRLVMEAQTSGVRPSKESASAIGRDFYAPDARARAILRGVEIVRGDLAAAGGAYDLDQVRDLLGGISRQAVAKRVSEGALLAVPGPSNKRRFPTFQFQTDGTLVPGLREVLAALPTRNDWAILNFLISPDSRLKGRTPMAMLREGSLAPVVAAARAWGEQGG